MEEYIEKRYLVEEFIERAEAWEAAAKIDNNLEYKGMARAYRNACDIITLMFSADVVEVKHGEWINDKGLYKCSVCNELWTHWWAIAVGDERMNKMMKFCPNCGADMRGEK